MRKRQKRQLISMAKSMKIIKTEQWGKSIRSTLIAIPLKLIEYSMVSIEVSSLVDLVLMIA